eukprot:CCRYP_008835-RA/>CCRYP_008835-RA protein AED:0.39 eAED:0.99 QI:0/-1/0/1/-1/0/1/0/91
MRHRCTQTSGPGQPSNISPACSAPRKVSLSTTTTHKRSSRHLRSSSKTTSSNSVTRIGARSPEPVWALLRRHHGRHFTTPNTKPRPATMEG